MKFLAVAERKGNNLQGLKDLCLKTSSNPGHNLALTVVFVPNSLDSERARMVETCQTKTTKRLALGGRVDVSAKPFVLFDHQTPERALRDVARYHTVEYDPFIKSQLASRN